MTNKRWLARELLLVTMLGAGTTVSASVDTSSKPGGVYKLKPGVYVACDNSCEAPAHAAIRYYDGRGISTFPSRACRVSVRAHKGNRFTVDQICLDSGAGPGRKQVEQQQVLVRDALTFTQTVNAVSMTYRYCPAYQPPRNLRQARH